MTGVWHATIIAPKGFRQVETEGDISYPLRLKTGEKPTAVDTNESQSHEPKAPCEGSVEIPKANPGTLCIYTGGGFGSKESEFKNASFTGIISPAGEVCAFAPLATTCKSESEAGTLVLFRTSGFEEAVEGGGPVLAEEAYLTQVGSWAVRQK